MPMNLSIGLMLGSVTTSGGSGGGASAPAAFVNADWSIADLNTVTNARITIAALPDDGGSPITDLEYSADGGAWTSLGGTATGDYDIGGLAYNVLIGVVLRAVNAVGAGATGNSEAVTPTGVAETDALTARFTTPPTTARAVAINDVFVSIAAFLSKLDALYVRAAADTQAAGRNWIADAYNITTVAAPTFVADRGDTGNGSSQFLDTNFNPATAVTPKFVQDSAHIGAYILTDVAQDGDDCGNGNSIVRSRSSANAFGGRVNQGATTSIAAIGTSVGHSVVRRPDAANIQHWKNGAQVGTTAVASVAPNSSNIWICRGGVGGYSTKQIAAVHFGQTLSDAEILTLYNALHTYMVAVGAA